MPLTEAGFAQRLHPAAPVAFGRCAGWFHPGGPGAGACVLICPPLGRELRWSHRGLRLLAGQLSDAGLSTLRFAYPGLGNSGDLEDGEDPVPAWCDSVQAAADWVRAESGAPRLVLVGLRFGALLAVDAAARRADVAGLALLAPVVSGRAHARELKLSAMASRPAGADPGVGPGVDIDLDGVALGPAALKAMGALDLARSLPSPGVPTLVLGPEGLAEPLLARVRATGAPVERQAFDGYDAFMQDNMSSRIPVADFAAVARWAAEVAGQPCHVTAPCREPRATALALRGCTERTVVLDQRRALSGVVCTPAGPAAAAVVIGNTGGEPNYGIGRFGTLVARRLAAAGIASIRIDFDGLGDSGADSDASHVYETPRCTEIAAALDHLQAEGHRRLGMLGVCSSAYHGFHTALDDTRIGLLIMINMVTFEWVPGRSPKVADRAARRSTRFYREQILQLEAWRRVARGEVEVRKIIATLAIRQARRPLLRVSSRLERWGIHLRLGFPMRAIRTLVARGVQVVVLMGSHDPGLEALESSFGQGARALARMPGTTVIIDRELDHTMSQPEMRDRGVELLLAAAQRFGRAAASTPGQTSAVD